MLRISCKVLDWCALSTGMTEPEDWCLWAENKRSLGSSDEKVALKHIPMLQARRMSIPSKLACEVFLQLLEKHEVQCAIFVSQHGELERSYTILECLARDMPLSPTDFSLSVHNTASGLATIIARKNIVVSSVCGNVDGFHQALVEAAVYFQQGVERIMLIDFDGHVPSFYHAYGARDLPAYACGLILEKGDDFTMVKNNVILEHDQAETESVQSLAFLKAYLNHNNEFQIRGSGALWTWTRAEA